MADTNTQNTTQQQNNAAPAVNGDQSSSGKMFTQDEVNNIVSERLKREREKLTATQTEDAKEKALNDRENKLSCREYVVEKGYKTELLDILDTTDVERFKATIDKIHEIYGVNPELEKNRAQFTTSKGYSFLNPPKEDPIRDAFLSK